MGTEWFHGRAERVVRASMPMMVCVIAEALRPPEWWGLVYDIHENGGIL
jgi:hypothetical protein